MSVFGPAEFAAAANVSRETLARLTTYVRMLETWNAKHNLVSETSIRDVWRRHFWDSAQLIEFIPPGVRSFVDLGSGAGFPGLVLAELLREKRVRAVLFEATAKKASFLRAVAIEMELSIEIRPERIENAKPETFDVLTARACAPLDRLLGYAYRFWGPATVGLFLKGQNIEAELTKARKSWNMKFDCYPSLSDPTGVILVVGELKRARK
jgi:16S rRNA (guanine527-N7)-methyltransferase